MKRFILSAGVFLTLSFSSSANSSLIQDLFNSIEKNEVVYEIKTKKQHEAVLNIFRDIEFREGFVEIDYQEAPIGNGDIFIIRATYLLEKEKFDKSKGIIAKLGLDIEDLKEKDYELTLNYIAGNKAHFELKEYKES